MFANVEARQIRGNRGELAAYLYRRGGLQVDEVHLRRSAVEMDVDHGLGRALDSCGSLSPQKLGKSKSANGTGSEEVTPSYAAAVDSPVSEQG